MRRLFLDPPEDDEPPQDPEDVALEWADMKLDLETSETVKENA